ncbi:MAG: PEP-CTERM sorting domain-containing protein [Betaproteobacteria bacterium]|nr:MAG: PEP-CTERM sorting domain-containing protein [Betaproteobacteria bacterium]
MTASAFVFDTTLYSMYAGYGRDFGANLVGNADFRMDFSLRIGAETHSGGIDGTRSGFSIVVTDESAQGIELSFWTDQVFAKNAAAGFPRGDSIAVDTTSKRDYRLTVLGGQYTLVTDGVPTLSGALASYAPYASWPFNVVPYGTPNYIFFGDNTSSASALVELSSITLAPVPEPAEWALMAVGLACVAGVVRRRRRAMAGAA